VWTSPNPQLYAAVVSFQRGSLNSQKLGQALYEKDKIGTAGRGGADRGGLRASPHFYNTPEEVDRLVAAVARYLKTGV
jgi:selenocysteine lyase/cysteine desulfurase